MMLRTILVASVALCAGALARADEDPPRYDPTPGASAPPLTCADEDAPPRYDPTDRYDAVEVAGWRVLVNRTLSGEHSDLHAETMTHLQHQLYQVVRKVPAAAVDKLREIPIWVEHEERHHPCMCYHPDAGWLRENDMNPEKAGAVEVANARNFLTWTLDQPWMVLHELAHGYHHLFLEEGYDNAEVLACYRASMDGRRYDEVLRLSGRTERAYAATNQMEYFAEASEALFGTNDFYPYVRSELEVHDPEFHALLKKLWRVAE